ncbi:unnamed protein product [Adineta ricciae]|uniref:Uncharacterized protein n=1 Tax=Adineta ricciae TaxID=249248 RepID=A0A815GF67_ADIRI|nr:unnamed protein product [Adineta ricciae]CAF1454066.1 unnamed protein product [Adineta ricciae]
MEDLNKINFNPIYQNKSRGISLLFENSGQNRVIRLPNAQIMPFLRYFNNTFNAQSHISLNSQRSYDLFADGEDMLSWPFMQNNAFSPRNLQRIIIFCQDDAEKRFYRKWANRFPQIVRILHINELDENVLRLGIYHIQNLRFHVSEDSILNRYQQDYLALCRALGDTFNARITIANDEISTGMAALNNTYYDPIYSQRRLAMAMLLNNAEEPDITAHLSHIHLMTFLRHFPNPDLARQEMSNSPQTSFRLYISPNYMLQCSFADHNTISPANLNRIVMFYSDLVGEHSASRWRIRFPQIIRPWSKNILELHILLKGCRLIEELCPEVEENAIQNRMEDDRTRIFEALNMASGALIENANAQIAMGVQPDEVN